MQQCHYALVDTHASHQAACQWEFDVCNTHAGVLNKMLNMFAGGFVICGIVFHELFSMLTMEYPIVLPNTTPFQAEPIPLARLWVLCTFLFSHLLLVVLCCTACMVRVYGFGNDFWSVVESIIAAFLILVMPQNIHAWPEAKHADAAHSHAGYRRQGTPLHQVSCACACAGREAAACVREDQEERQHDQGGEHVQDQQCQTCAPTRYIETHLRWSTSRAA